MRFKGLDLNLLVSLDALLIERNVSAAARRTFVSQPAMSSALARLRAHFKDELLVPLGRQLVLTAFAESICEPVSQLMLQIEATVDVDGEFSASNSRRIFKIAVSDYMTELLMPQVAAKVASQAPGVLLDIVAPSGMAAEMIESGAVDLSIGAETARSLFHPYELLLEEPAVIIGWDQNERLRRPITPEDFFEMGRVVARFGKTRNLSFAEMHVHKFAQKQKVELIAPSFTSIPNFLIGTNRIALMHKVLADFYTATLPLISAPLPFEIEPQRVVVQYHSVRTPDVGIQWLVSLIRESISSNSYWYKP